MIEIRIALTKKQRDFDEAVEKYPVTLFGGARGAGKSHSLRAIMLKRRFKYPGSIGYIFRKTFPELEANHISPLFEHYPALREYYNEGKKTLKLPNGSQLRFAYCEHERDLPKFQGREIHDLGIEEAGDWPEHYFQMLRASNRSSNPKIKPRCLLTGNPGGIGTKWLKRLFVEKDYREEENEADYYFVPARVYDNPALMAADPDYIKRLSAMASDTLKRAWLDGDWNVEAGLFFSEFRREKHVVDDFTIPAHWMRIIGYDWGFNHPMAIVWGAVDEQGTVYIYREFNQSRVYIDEAAKYLKSFADFKQVGAPWAGRDCWVTKNAASKDSNPTIADQFKAHGITLKPANVARIAGAAQMRSYLRYTETQEPKLKFFKSCSKTINCITRLIHDENEPEDVLKEDATEGDTNSGDDLYDALRHLIMSRPRLAVAPRPPRGSDRRYFRPSEESGETSWATV